MGKPAGYAPDPLIARDSLFKGCQRTLVAIGWYQFRPALLFVSRRVNEQCPGTSAPQMAAVNASPTVFSQGNCHGVAHETKGMSARCHLPGGKRVLRFTEFAISNGPDVQIYLVAAADADLNTYQAVTFCAWWLWRSISLSKLPHLEKKGQN
jgi:hypothetical protein